MPPELESETTAPKPSRRVWRYVLAVLLLAVVAGIAAPVIYLSNAGGIKGVLEAQLSDALGDAPVSVGDVGFEFRMPSMHVTLIAYDASITLQDTQIDLPQASAVFSLNSLWQMAPYEVVLSGLELDVTADGAAATSPLGLLAGVVVAPDKSDSTIIERSRNLRIDSGRLTLRSASPSVAPLLFDDIELDMMVAADGTFVGSLEGRRLVDNGSGGRIALAAIGDIAARDIRLDVTTNEFSAVALAPFLPDMPAVAADAGTLSGNANLMITGGRLAGANIDMVALGGSLDLTLAGLPRLDYDTASMIMEYQAEAGRLSLAQAELALADGRTVSLSGDVDALHSQSPQFALRLRGNQWPIDQVYADWPAKLAPEVKTALSDRFSGGDISNFTLEVAGGLDRVNARLEIVSLDLRSVVRGMFVDVGSGQYQRLAGIADGSLDLSLGAGGVVEGLSVSAGVGDGMLTLADYPTPLPLNRFQVTAALDGDAFRLDDISLTLADGGAVAVTGDVTLGAGWKINAADLNVTARSFDLRRFHAIWPEWLVSRTRSWVAQKMPEGRVKDVRLQVKSRFDGEKPRITALDGSITLANATLELGRKIPAFTNLDGRLIIADNRGEIILTEGRVDGLVLSTGKVSIDPIIKPVINGKPSRGTTDLRLSGDIGDAIRVANRLGIGGATGFDLMKIQASGASDLVVRTAFPVRRKLPPEAIEFDVEAVVGAGTFTNLPLGADAREADIRVKASRSSFEIRGDARVFGLPAKLAFRSQPKPGGGEATLDLITSGSDLDRVAEIAGSLGVTGFAGVEFSELTLDGIADVTVNASFPTGRKLTQDDVTMNTDIVIQDGRFAGLPIIGSATDAELVGRFSRGGTEMSGTAMLFGAPVDFVVTEDRLADRLVFKANAPSTPGLARLMATMTDLDIQGGLGGSIMLATGSALSDFEIELGVNLAETSIEVPSIGWVKLPAEPGKASMRLVLENGQPVAIEDIDIEAGSLAVIGRASLGPSAGNGPTVTAASFRRLAWPGNDIGMLELSRDVNGEWLITAEAELIDLVPLRRNRGLGKGRPVSFDIVAQKIIVGDGISLSGHISGNKKSAGGGEASFSGNLNHRNKTLISEGEMQMSFGQGGDYLNGVGIVGGAETTLTYSAGDGEVPELTMSSQNGGGTLAGLNITDSIRSGEMFLRTRYVDGFENFDTTIRITNFTVVEAPRAVRAFSVLAPTGLYNLVEGEGTGFAWGEARIEKRGQKINLTQVTGMGAAVSVAFVGQYDKETRQVDVSGNLVPASFFSQIIGGIPIVGEILTGVDNAGLFVTQFSMTGSIDDPDSSITPASIVPGVLRDLFSPAWLRREGDRILGPSANGTNGNDDRTGG